MKHTLERIYREHRQGLYTLALSITRCTGRAEDAVHDAFARLWRRGTLPGGDLLPYVFAAVRNAAIDQLRRAPPAAGREAASIFVAPPADPADAALDAELQRQVRQSLESLPPDQREAVVLKVYGGLTFDQIARTLGEPLPTVASRYRRALEALAGKIRRVMGAVR